MAFVVNVLFKIKTEGIFSAEWSARDALNYVGAMAGSISTFVLRGVGGAKWVGVLFDKLFWKWKGGKVIFEPIYEPQRKDCKKNIRSTTWLVCNGAGDLENNLEKVRRTIDSVIGKQWLLLLTDH